MPQVYFNSCYQSAHAVQELAVALNSCLREYKRLKERLGDHLSGVVTAKVLAETLVSTVPANLGEVVSFLPRDMRQYAYSLFRKYPLEDYLIVPEEVEDDLGQNDYFLVVETVSYPAFDLKLVHSLKGVSMTLNTGVDLAKDHLEVVCHVPEGVDFVDNLYGETSNTDRLALKIETDIAAELPVFEKLLFEFGEPHVNERFEKQFSAFSKDVQDVILREVTGAKDRPLPGTFDADDALVKQLKGEQAKKYNLRELRVHQPKAVRLYFAELEGEIYLASVMKKPSDKTQSNHINTAAGTVGRMVAERE